MTTDNELILRVQAGDVIAEEILAKRYNQLVRICARQFFLVGGDSEDLIQEGMFGLLRAIRTYDTNRSASFKTYADHCIRNRLINVIEAAGSRKHSPLNSGVSIESMVIDLSRESHNSTGEDFLRSTEIKVLEKETLNEMIKQRVQQLTKLEKNVLDLYLAGMTYREIADNMDKSEKSIDNAVQRIRKKFAKDN